MGGKDSKSTCLKNHDDLMKTSDCATQLDKQGCKSTYNLIETTECETPECETTECETPELFIISLPMPKDPEASLKQHHLHISEISFTDTSGNAIVPTGCMQSSAYGDRTCDLTYDNDTNTINHTEKASDIHMLQYQLPSNASLQSVTITNRSGKFSNRLLGANLMYIKNNQVVWTQQVRSIEDTYTFTISESFVFRRRAGFPTWLWILIIVGILYYYQRNRRVRL